MRFTRPGFGFARAALVALCISAPSIAWAQDAGACDTSCLTGAMDRFIDAMTSGRTADVPLAPASEVRENTARVSLDETVWRDVEAVRSRVVFADAVTGNVIARTGVELTDGSAGYVSTRLRIVGEAQITDVEISADRSPRVVSDYVWNLDGLLSAPVPAAQRTSRLELEALAGRYFHSLSTHAAVAEDFAPGCNRFHSGEQITNSSNYTGEGGQVLTCSSSLEGNPPWGPATEHRFPVIDPERGIIVGLTLLHYLSESPPRQMYVSEVFKVVGGRIVHIDNIGLMLDGVETMGFVH